MDAILKNNFQNILAGYQKVADYTVSGSAISSYDFTGLNITKEDDFILVADIVDNSNTNDVLIYVNGNTTATNYWSQQLFVSGTSANSYHVNYPSISYVNTAQKTSFIAKLKLTNNGYFNYQVQNSMEYNTSSIRIGSINGKSNFTMSSITTIRVQPYFNATNKFAIGTRFQLYKRVAPIVADITVSSATTSVDITGFTMDKGSEYMLVSDVLNPLGSEIYYYLYANTNYTSTNYYRQGLVSITTNVGGDRNNNSYLCSSNGSGRVSLSMANLKLTNNGYFIYQNNNSINYSNAGDLYQQHIYGTSTFTATSITSLRINSGATNAIGVGSRFQLIKLK